MRTSSGPRSAARWPGRSSRRRRTKQDRRAGKQEKAAKQEAKAAKAAQKRAAKTAEKAHTRDSVQALSKLGELVDGTYRIVSQPPVVVPFRDWTATYGLPADQVDKVIRDQFRAYRATLQDDRRKLLERFQVVDAARKVVGVGSVGTRAFIVLLQGRDAQDPLFLQIKEATASVLEPYVRQEPVPAARRAGGAGAADDAGRQRHLPRLDQGGGRAPPLLLAAAARHEGLGAASKRCRRSRSRSTQASAGGRWPGPTPGPGTRSPSPPTWATATRSTSRSPASRERYADQNERDYTEFVNAVRSGRLEAVEGV